MLLLAALFLAQSAPAPASPAPVQGPPSPIVLTSPLTAEPVCEDQPSDSDEIVVCGQQQPRDSPHRLPPEFRSRPGQIDDQDMSHAARTRDFNALERYSSQTVGPAGYMQRSREQDCQYRAARQEAQGRQIDCTARSRRDSATDWQRR